MAIKEEKTVTVADAVVAGSRIKVVVGRDLTVDESKELRKMLKKAEAGVSCERTHWAEVDFQRLRHF